MKRVREATVDANLESVLSTQLPPADVPLKNKGSTFDDGLHVEEDADLNKPIPPSTRIQHERIFELLASLKSIIHPDQLTSIMGRIKKMNFDEAETYILCLKGIRQSRLTGGLSARLLSITSEYLLHPDDDETLEDMLNDHILRDEIGDSIGDLLAVIGKLAGPLLMGTYIATSWLYGEKRKKTREQRQSEYEAEEAKQQQCQHSSQPPGGPPTSTI